MADDKGFKIAQAFVQVSPDTTGFKEELQAQVEEATDGVEGKVKVTLDTSELDAKADEARAKVDELDDAMAEPSVRLDSGDLDEQAEEAHAKLDELDAKSARPDVGLESEDLDAEVDEAKAKLDDLTAQRAEPRADLDTSDFDAKLDAARAKLAEFNEQSASARLGGSGSSGGGSGGEGSLLGALTMGVGSLLPGIGGATAGMGLLGATGAMAFGGIAKALSAAHQASQNVGLTSAQLASTEFSNSVQIQQAQQSIAQAHEQAAQDAVSSAESIESAQMNLASVERNAAESQIQALQQVQQAQQGVEQADYGLSEAQYQLTQAWVQAREQITQLNDQLADSKLNVQSASLAVQQAEYNELLVNQNAYSTDLDRQQAALAVAQAKQQLTDATDQESDAQTAANLANSQGVAGSQTVIQAKQALTQAQYAQTDAQQQYADAQRNLTLTQINNAAQIKQAQMQVAQAQEQAAYQQMVDAQNVRIAQQNLTNTVKEQQLQMAATESTSNQAANQFLLDMSKLTPAGRAFVDQILGMRNQFRGLEAAAQNAVVPGFTVWLRGIQALAPTIESGVSKMGGAISQAFAGFGKQMQTPAAAHILDGLINNGIRFANIVLPAFSKFVAELGEVGAKKGAADGLANLLAGIIHGLTGLAASVGKYTPEINQFLTAVGNIIAQMGPSLGTIIGLIATALGPLDRYLNSHPNGTIVKVLGDIAGGLLALKGLQKILPDFITGPLEKISGKVTSQLVSPFKTAAGKIPGALSSAWQTIQIRGLYAADGIKNAFAKVPGFFTSTLPGALSTGASSLKDFASKGGTRIAQWGTTIGSTMGNAVTSVTQFAVTFGQKLAQATMATITWIGEQVAAGATFIAENIMEAASATAAFVAENAASLGLIAGITALVAAIVYLATHWRQVWSDIKQWAEDAWNFIYNGFGKYLLPLIGPAGLIALGVIELAQHWQQVWDTIKNAAQTVWNAMKQGGQQFVSDFKTVWNTLEDVFKTPVNFLIQHVYTGGIERFWNDVVQAIGLSSLKLPNIPGLATGGVIPGYAPGRDTVPAMLSPGEGVLVPEAVRAIGPGTVHTLNATYGRGRKSGPTRFAGGGITDDRQQDGDEQQHGLLEKETGRQARKHGVERPAEHVIGLAGGGVLSDITGGISSAYHAVTGAIGKAVDVGKIVAALATGNTSALSNALDAMVGTPAAGQYAQMMLGIPKTLVSDAVKQIAHMFTGGSGPGISGASTPGAASGTVASWFQKAVQLTGVGAGWIPDLETIAHYESGDNPNAINLSDSNAAAGDPSRGIMQTIMTTFDGYHQPGTSNNIFDPVANIAAAINYIKARYGTVGNVPGIVSLAHGGGYVGYDQGGWLMPSGMPVNGLGRPEAVLTPDESAAFVAIAKQLTQQGSAAPLGSKQVVIQFNGTQYPTTEQMAAIKRDMALALGGAS